MTIWSLNTLSNRWGINVHESTVKLRLYPNNHQKTFIHQQLGCCRFVWNNLLGLFKTRYEDYENGIGDKPEVSRKTLEKELLVLKEQYDFLKEVSSVSLQQTTHELYDAYRGFFRKDKGFPRFKSKSNRNSFRVVGLNKIKFIENKLYLPKNQTPIKTKGNHIGEFPISSYRVVQEPDGKYYVCFVTKVDALPAIPYDFRVGIDLGIKHLLTVAEENINTGEIKTSFVKNNQYYLKAQKRLKRLQQSLSRKKKGSHNRQRARLKVAKAHKSITNKRNDTYHKLSTSIANKAKQICLEDLSIVKMLKNKLLAKYIQDASWNKLVSMIKYKAERRGSIVGFAYRFFPSTQLCSTCNTLSKTKIALGVGKWECSYCHAQHDRDVNAAINLLMEGKEILEATVG